MIGHLGSRVSALLDGQLSPAETDRAWAHVHLCHVCRDAVEREGWVKTRLAALGGTSAPSHLKGSLLGPPPAVATAPPPVPSRRPGRLLLGGSAAGAAVLGVVALGMVVVDGPPDPRTPVTNLPGSDSPVPQPSRTHDAQRR